MVGTGSVWFMAGAAAALIAAGANAALYEPSAANISCAATLPAPVPDCSPLEAVPPTSVRTERPRKPPA